MSRDAAAARDFYTGALGLHMQADGDYLHTGGLPGSKHFAVWPDP